MNLNEKIVPPGLLAAEGVTEVTIVLRVPAPPDSTVATTLASLLEAAELADIYTAGPAPLRAPQAG